MVAAWSYSECGTKVVEVVSGWHFTIPNLREKRHISINYLPELVED